MYWNIIIIYTEYTQLYVQHTNIINEGISYGNFEWNVKKWEINSFRLKWWLIKVDKIFSWQVFLPHTLLSAEKYNAIFDVMRVGVELAWVSRVKPSALIIHFVRQQRTWMPNKLKAIQFCLYFWSDTTRIKFWKSSPESSKHQHLWLRRKYLNPSIHTWTERRQSFY